MLDLKNRLQALNPAPKNSKHVIFFAFCLVLLFLGLLPETLLEKAEFYYSSPFSLRWFSAHFIHLTFTHALLNVTGMIILWFLAVAYVPSCVLMWMLLLAPWLVSIGLYQGGDGAISYRGFSGIFCGFYVAGVIWCWRESRLFSLFLGAFLVLKIVFEQLPGFDNSYLMSTIGGLVAQDAHLYGALAGCFISCLFMLGIRMNIIDCRAPWRTCEHTIK
jgi:rhomboid family GlyGly-CTERM serine protease